MRTTTNSTRAEPHRDVLAAIFRCGAAYADRLPMLPVAFERAALAFGEEMRGLSSAPFEANYLGLDSGCAADLLDAGEGDRLTGMMHAAAWDAHLLVSVDRAIVYAYVDLVFGGDGSQPAYVEQRPLSRIEIQIARTLFTRIAGALSHGFGPFAPTAFLPVGELGRPDTDRLGGRQAAVATARFRLAAGSGGELRVAIPDAVLTALKPAFVRPAPGGAAAADPAWSQQIHREIRRAPFSLRAILEERQRPLADVVGLQIGQVLPLHATARSSIRLDCNGEPLLWCELGQSSGNYTVRVQGFVDREQEFMDGLLSG